MGESTSPGTDDSWERASDEAHSQRTSELDLSSVGLTFILTVRLSTGRRIILERRACAHGLILTYDQKEARLFIGNVGTRRRAEFELRCLGLLIESDLAGVAQSPRDEQQTPVTKRKKSSMPSKGRTSKEEPIMISSDSESEVDRLHKSRDIKSASDESTRKGLSKGEQGYPIRMVSTAWLEKSLDAGTTLSLEDFTVFKGYVASAAKLSVTRTPQGTGKQDPSQGRYLVSTGKLPTPKSGKVEGILERARADAGKSSTIKPLSGYVRSQKVASRSLRKRFEHGLPAAHSSQKKPPQLVRQTTSENDEELTDILPELPDWVKENQIFACERATEMNPPNKAFIDELKKIKIARLLTGDEIGVRAYSTSIASLAAFPHTLSSTREILALPGCDTKIASLFQEWSTQNRHIKAVEEIEKDESLQILNLFYEIWGVGAETARKFYFERGWRDLDDVVEYGWNTLSRVQQIGVKFYDEFQEKIPREEVRSIADKVAEHARRLTLDGTIEMCIVGGYRRGKQASGDVDIVLSHKDESQTLGLVQSIVVSLEQQGWITHTLILGMAGSKRDQQPLPHRGGGAGAGFDTLDKALVVWQDSQAEKPIHRRVDIIIAPWPHVGTAIVGWSGGTTFQRDLRRYARHRKGWKFDSSGVRDRITGRVVDIEVRDGKPAETWEEAEKRVFEGMGLEFREPWERCTG